MPTLLILSISKLNPVWQDEIYKAANRPLNTGFFYEAPGHEDHIFEPEDKVVGFDFVGLVMGYDAESGTALIQQRNHFKPGQEIEFFGPDGTHFKQKVGIIRNEDGQELDAARHPLQMIKLQTDQTCKKMGYDAQKNRKIIPWKLSPNSGILEKVSFFIILDRILKDIGKVCRNY